MINRFTPRAQGALNNSLFIACEMGHTYIGSEHLLLGLLKNPESMSAKILANHKITFEASMSYIKNISGVGEKTTLTPSDMTPRMRKIIESSALAALQCGENIISSEHILIALLNEADSFGAKAVSALGAQIPSIINEAKDNSEKSIPSEPKPKKKDRSPTLALYSADLTEEASLGKLDILVGRAIETDRLIRILCRRTKNNPCLIGQAGVGKTAIVEGLAQRIASGNIPEPLNGKTILKLDITQMLAGSKYRGEFEDRMKNVLIEAKKNPDLILFIDEVHTIMGAGAAEGAIDAANIIKPALSRGEIQIIGATTTEEYRRYIERDAALERRFQPVVVNEPSRDEAITVLQGIRDKYEAHHKLKISDEAIEAAVRLSSRYIHDRYLPDKAIDLIDEASARLRLSQNTLPDDIYELLQDLRDVNSKKEDAVRHQQFETAAMFRDRAQGISDSIEERRKNWQGGFEAPPLTLTKEDIASLVSEITGIPIDKCGESERERLLNLENILRKDIIGQDKAIESLARAIRKNRVGLSDAKRPIGSFIFLGTSGVGKTALAKALASTLYGGEDSMIRLDMSEYMEKFSVSSLIGSPPGYVGYEEGGRLTERVRRRPYSVILFDEIEKAHPDIYNILLQILEDGSLTDSRGLKVDFSNTVIIMTSNSGTSELDSAKSLGFFEGSGRNYEKILLDSLSKQFRPEFLNRVDDIIVFAPLTDESLGKITDKLLEECKNRAEKQDIFISFDPKVKELILKDTDRKEGARPVRRKISTLIDTPLALYILSGRIGKSQSVLLTVKNSEVCIAE